MNIKGNIQDTLNILYGDNEDYSFINKKGFKVIIKEHLKSLERIYKLCEKLENEKGGCKTEDLYNLGDTINLVDAFIKNMDIEEIEEDY